MYIYFVYKYIYIEGICNSLIIIFVVLLNVRIVWFCRKDSYLFSLGYIFDSDVSIVGGGWLFCEF